MKKMKKVLAIVLLAAMIMSAVCVTAFASSSKVTTGKVRMRKGAALSYASIQTIPKGVWLTCTDSKKDSRGVRWYYCSYNGKSGWVSSKYLSSDSGSSSSGKIKATGGDTYIRSSASRSGSIRGTLKKGHSATYLGSSKKDSRGVRWYKVKYNGVTGWVSSKYTTKY